MRKRVTALAVAGVLSVGLMVSARAQQRAAQPENPPDVKALLFELGNGMGMLRGLQQEDSIITQEYWATGTVTRGQQRLELSEFRMSVNYAVPGMRVDYTGKGSDGRAQRTIHVVSGNTAWNETERGRNATPAPDAVKQRLVQLWSTPMGVVKAARAAGANAKIATSGGTTTLVFPLPAPANDVTMTATLRRDASLVKAHANAMKTLIGTYVTRVQTAGAVVSDTTYAEYGDWNWDDYKSDIMLPRRAVWKSGDETVDLTTKNTNTYNPYVVMPVPENIKQAASRQA
jgi:hypothetical protein